ncbi:hypothetical protein HYH03_001175 [Edaphochlamys debaryana]|uniref:Uncharacterized protein n=1 Tax=Edaphochlamys debaryana TaxID=47281 RepID=A0A836C749_9CHLO|nr:hypothetical protein HYH03_001175 [Edaphochlamys debaryana]|eukprot:KAG2501387.1 hypothetical protein HYH03_001175 [Edaphochlamys debaryana]
MKLDKLGEQEALSILGCFPCPSPAITSLHINGRTLTPVTARAIGAAFPELTELVVDRSSWNRACDSAAEGLALLVGSAGGAEKAAQPALLPRLEHLALWDCHSPLITTALSGAQRLKTLYTDATLHGSGLTASLARAGPQLAALSAVVAEPASVLPALLPPLTGLRRLFLGDAKCRLEPSLLACLPHLEELAATGALLDVRGLGQLSQLRVLRVESLGVGEVGMRGHYGSGESDHSYLTEVEWEWSEEPVPPLEVHGPWAIYPLPSQLALLELTGRRQSVEALARLQWPERGGGGSGLPTAGELLGGERGSGAAKAAAQPGPSENSGGGLQLLPSAGSVTLMVTPDRHTRSRDGRLRPAGEEALVRAILALADWAPGLPAVRISYPFYDPEDYPPDSDHLQPATASHAPWLEALSQLPSLRRLQLRGVELQREEIKTIVRRLPRLEELSLLGPCLYPLDSVPLLRHLRRLKLLKLDAQWWQNFLPGPPSSYTSRRRGEDRWQRGAAFATKLLPLFTAVEGKAGFRGQLELLYDWRWDDQTNDYPGWDNGPQRWETEGGNAAEDVQKALAGKLKRRGLTAQVKTGGWD